ncbi:MAG: DUF3828 domain-containing protein [Acidobacteriota bacterium]|nr:MAG: DUF3828 domain-containing protein [Acidobacteriota bacterium]
MLFRFSVPAVVFVVLFCASCGLIDLGRKDVSNTNTRSIASEGDVPETPAVAGGESQSSAAEALVADLYKQHDAKKSPFHQTSDRARVDKYFAKELADLIWKDALRPSDEGGSIDADPLYNAQDIDIKNFNIGTAKVTDDYAILPVTFTNFGQKQSLKFKMKRTGGNWKITDISYSPKDSLLTWLKANDSSTKTTTTAASGEFEGKYRVGETTCTVSPDRMAFQVKWAKGSGSEYFFYKDANTFESEPDKSGGRNEFRFDDENYNSGTFVRADGKVFSVSRAR